MLVVVLLIALPFIRTDCPGGAAHSEPLAGPLTVGMNFPATFIRAVAKRCRAKEFQGYKCFRMFVLFSELSWEGFFIRAIIILGNLIGNLFRK